MITQKEWKKKPLSYWKGKKVRTLREMENGNFKIPIGTILEIKDKYCGVELKGLEVCSHCEIGRKISISKVEPTALMLWNGV